MDGAPDLPDSGHRAPGVDGGHRAPGMDGGMTPFVGREAELRRLGDLLDRALAGECSVCLVTGEAGTGKTALLTEFARRAQDADPDLVVAMGDCNARTGLGDPFLPFREILGMLTGDVETHRARGRITRENAGRLQRLLRTSAELLVENGPDLVGIFVPAGGILARLGARAVAGRVPWMERLQRLAGREGTGRPEADALDQRGSEQARDRMFEQYTNVLRALARRHPLVLVLDDLQWADEASIALLFHLDRRLQTERILIVGAYRPGEVRLGRSRSMQMGRSGGARISGSDDLRLGGSGDVGARRSGGRHPLEPVVNEIQRTHGDVRIDLSAAAAGGRGTAGVGATHGRSGGRGTVGAGGALGRSGGPEESSDERSPAPGDPSREFLDALVDTEPNRLGEEFREALYRHTGGHPLFTLELLRSMREGGELVPDGEGRWTAPGDISWDSLPPRVEAVIEERARRLDPELDETLSVASVEGERFTAEVAARVLDLDDRTVVRRLSGPLVREHRLVRAHGRDRIGGRRVSRYGFHHSLVQRFFYRRLDSVELGYLHGDVGETLEELYGDAADEVAPELARHFELAGMEREAVGYLCRAGERARRAYAHSEASTHLERALRLLRDAPPGAFDERWRRETERRLLESRGDLAVLAGEPRRALEAYRGALELSPEAGLTTARLHRKSAKPYERRMELDAALEALDRAREALGEPGEGVPDAHDPPDPTLHGHSAVAGADSRRPEDAWREERIAIGLARAWMHYWRDDPDGLEEVRRRLGPVVEELGRSDTRFRLANLDLLMRYRRERYRLSEETLELADRFERGCREADHPRDRIDGRFAAGFVRLWRAELGGAEDRLLMSLQAAEKYGDLHLASRALTYLTICCRRMCRVAETEETARRALRVSEDASVREYVGTARANLAWVALRRGRSDDARRLASAALEVWDDLAYEYPIQWTARLPLAAALTGDQGSARGSGGAAAARSVVLRRDEGSANGPEATRLAELLRPLLAPPQMHLPEPLEARLDEAVRALEAGESQEAGESPEARRLLADALDLAREGGFA